MPTKNIIFNSLKESFNLILKNKSLFVLLLILQIIFFIVFSLISYTYVSKMVESQKAIEDYLSNLNFDEASVTSSILEQKSILGEDPLSISRNFNTIIKNIRLYLISIFILSVVFTSVSWTITQRLIYKISFKKLFKNIFKIFIVLLFYFGAIFLFFISLLNISITQLGAQSSMLFLKYFIFLIISIILVYFMFVSISLTNNTELKNIVQKTLTIGIKKIHYMLAIYFINMFLFAFSIFLLFYFIEKNLFVLLLSLIFMIFSFAFGRIFMVSVVEKLQRS